MDVEPTVGAGASRSMTCAYLWCTYVEVVLHKYANLSIIATWMRQLANGRQFFRRPANECSVFESLNCRSNSLNEVS